MNCLCIKGPVKIYHGYTVAHNRHETEFSFQSRSGQIRIYFKNKSHFHVSCGTPYGYSKQMNLSNKQKINGSKIGI